MTTADVLREVLDETPRTVRSLHRTLQELGCQRTDQAVRNALDILYQEGFAAVSKKTRPATWRRADPAEVSEPAASAPQRPALRRISTRSALHLRFAVMLLNQSRAELIKSQEVSIRDRSVEDSIRAIIGELDAVLPVAKRAALEALSASEEAP